MCALPLYHLGAERNVPKANTVTAGMTKASSEIGMIVFAFYTLVQSGPFHQDL